MVSDSVYKARKKIFQIENNFKNQVIQLLMRTSNLTLYQAVMTSNSSGIKLKMASNPSNFGWQSYDSR
jgi:hypothetical protein